VARPTQVSPFATFRAVARNVSSPAVFRASTRASNEPLGARVIRRPAKIRSPSCAIRTAQVCPTRFWSTSNSTSIRPSSGESFSFQSLAPLHDPRRITSASLACAGRAPTSMVPATRPAIANRFPFIRTSSRSLARDQAAARPSKPRASTI